jgi:hypothetical protein
MRALQLISRWLYERQINAIENVVSAQDRADGSALNRNTMALSRQFGAHRAITHLDTIDRHTLRTQIIAAFCDRGYKVTSSSASTGLIAKIHLTNRLALLYLPGQEDQKPVSSALRGACQRLNALMIATTNDQTTHHGADLTLNRQKLLDLLCGHAVRLGPRKDWIIPALEPGVTQ